MKVSVVTLTNGTRPAMLARAIRCVVASTHPDIEHIVFDAAPYAGRTIGYIRNIANSCAAGELIAHFDDDDWSYPRRIEEQVALLQASGKQCVGFRELLFWDTRCEACDPIDTATGASLHAENCPPGEAWLYRNDDPRWVAGASMLYTREAWEACPFDDAPHEDQRWWMKNANKCVGISAIDSTRLEEFQSGDQIQRDAAGDMDPRMICGIHGGNTETYDRAAMLAGSQVWRSAPEWDKYCEEKMRCA